MGQTQTMDDPCISEARTIEIVPSVTVAQMREVDRMMIDDIGVGLLQMMENAGRSLAELAINRFAPRSVTVLAGTGNNGGGGLAAARHLVNRGIVVNVAVTENPEPGTAAHTQLRAARGCGVNVIDRPVAADLVVDALVGYGLSGPLRGSAASLAAWVGEQRTPVLALDTPSGLDLTTGVAVPGSVRATATMTLALPKSGLIASDEVGELYVADISVPNRVLTALGIDSPRLFDRGPIARLAGGKNATPLRLSKVTPTWSTPVECLRLIVTGATFSTAVRIALVVGTLLTMVNLGHVIVGGQAGPATYLQIAANYAIPYVVSSLGVLSHTRVRRARAIS